MVNALNEMIGNRAGHGDPDKWQHPVVKTEATTGQGTEELAGQIERCFAFLAEHPAAARARRITQLRARALEIARDMVSARMQRQTQGDTTHAQLMDEVLARRQDPYVFAEAMMRYQQTVDTSEIHYNVRAEPVEALASPSTGSGRTDNLVAKYGILNN